MRRLVLTHVILLVVQRRSSVVEVRLDARPRPVGIRVRVQKIVDEVGNPVGDEAQQERRHDHHDLLDDRQTLTGLRFIKSLLEGRDAVVSVLVGASSLLCLLYTSPSPRDKRQSRMPSSA